MDLNCIFIAPFVVLLYRQPEGDSDDSEENSRRGRALECERRYPGSIRYPYAYAGFKSCQHRGGSVVVIPSHSFHGDVEVSHTNDSHPW